MARDKRRKLARSYDVEGLPLQGDEPAAPAYNGVGQALRAERLRLGQDLYDVADHLRIKYSQMLAIEEGRFGELPGHVYAVGFLRTYATHLGLDVEAVLQAFKEETEQLPVAGRLVFPAPAPETRTPRGGLIVVALLLAGAIYGAWYYAHSKGRSLTELVSPVPARMLETAPKPADPAVETAAETAAAPAGASTPATGASAAPAASSGGPATDTALPPAAAPKVAEDETAGAGNPSAAPAAANPHAPSAAAVESAPQSNPAARPASGALSQAPMPPAADDRSVQVAALPPQSGDAAGAASGGHADAAAPAASVPQGTAFGSTDADVRVVLKAHADSWIDVRSSSNEVLLPGRVLHQGDSYRVPNRPDVVLWTGNLGALEVVVDGKSLPRLGGFGESRRNISLDPKRLLAGTALNR